MDSQIVVDKTNVDFNLSCPVCFVINGRVIDESHYGGNKTADVAAFNAWVANRANIVKG